ncbi:MAG: Eco57I restriction-modification methylase domain-containing protein [Candidatus Omnitrophica bacterium]|nr:Eco57I restriction-modification methylase domain-containing protein [Candidatus Omnitrophota bacterium]
MLETIVKIPKQLNALNDSLQALRKKPSYEQVQIVINNVTALLNINKSDAWKPFNDSQGKIRSNASWFMVAKGFADKRAAYKIAENNSQNIDLKCFWMKKLNKSVISWLVALTPNFEDEPFYGNLNVGIDFVIPEEADKVLVVLSKNYVIRTVELQDALSVTQQDIFSAWLTDFDYSNKAQVHEILWKSFDLEPVNKSFYKGISSFFVELKQFLVEDAKIFDDKHAAYFTNRLIGRIVFCWFLNKKGIINSDMQYFQVGDIDADQYYHQKLETLFFKVFNTSVEERGKGVDVKTPFLNGGLFEIKDNDKFENPSLTFPKDYFDRFFQFLRHYNFTTDESTSTFQQVAIDPEMLGRIFENLLAEQVEETGEQARKAKGAFYTPREIVDYMCRESLREYLKTKISEDDLRDQRIELLLDVKPHEFRDQQRNYRSDLKPYKYDILKALDEIKIIDPACGSGAFPMGMLHLLLTVYERLDNTFDSYKKKINIIKNNLFGVDIEPMAVEICRLRAWLSIIVDEESDSKKIEPLPNLDFKFICANSLIPLIKEDGKELFDTINHSELIEIRDKYFNARTRKSKEDWHKKYEKIIGYKKTGNMFHSDREKQLRSYHPFDAENVSQFFDADFMFGVEDGFNNVIGNPPYGIVYEDLKKGLYLKRYKSFKRNNDIYVSFLECAFSMISKKGVVSFITPNSYQNGDYFVDLRNLLISSTKIVEIVDFKNLRVFADPTVFVSIIFFKKEVVSKQEFEIKRMHAIEPHFKFETEMVILDSNRQKSNALKSINLVLQKIEGQQNVKAFDEVFFIKDVGFNYWTKGKGKKRDGKSIGSRVLYKGEKKNQNDVPFLKGRDINRYSLSKPTNYLKHNYCEYLDNEIDTFRFSKEYLKMSPKLIYRQTSANLCATIDLNGNYLDKTVHMVIPKSEYREIIDLRYVLAIVNSSLMNYLYNYVSQESSGRTFAQVKTTYVKKLPLKMCDESKQLNFVELVNEILNAKKKNVEIDTKEIENKIDELVFELYQVTLKERKIILGKDAE